MVLYHQTQRFAFAILDTGSTIADLIAEGRRLELVFLNVMSKDHPQLEMYITNMLRNWDRLSNIILVHIRKHHSSLIAYTFSEALNLCQVILPTHYLLSAPLCS